MGGSSKGGSTTVQGVNPYQAAQADFLFNRFNQVTPTSSLTFTPPGGTPPQSQQVGFIPSGLTSQAAAMFPQGNATKGTQGGGVPMPPGGSATKGTQGGSVPPTSGTVPTPTVPSGPTASATQDRFHGRGPTGTTTNPYAGLKQAIQNGQPATATQTLAPAVMALENAKTTTTANTLADVLNRQNAISSGGLPQLTSNLNTNGLASGNVGFSGLPATPDSLPQFNQDIVNTMFNLGAQPLQREFGRNLDTLEQSLANKGLALGGDAAGRAISDFSREQSQALSDLASRSVLAGGQESSRALGDILNTRGQLSGEQQAAYGMAEAQRQARLGEQVQNASLAQNSRLTQLNELQALLGQQQVGAPPIQSFLQTSPTGVMDAFGLNQNAQIANAQNAAQMKGSMFSGLSQLGSAAILR